MQPLGRTVVLGHSLGQPLLGLQLRVKPGAAAALGRQSAAVAVSSFHFSCRRQLFRSQAWLYSSQLPPSNPEKQSGEAVSAGSNHATASGPFQTEKPVSTAETSFTTQAQTQVHPHPQSQTQAPPRHSNPRKFNIDAFSNYAQRFTLPSSLESRRSELERKFSLMMDQLQTRALNASQTLNEVTGYTSIESIKRENALLETSLADAQARVRAARQAYKSSNSKRAATQREVTTLLARKESWSPSDLERFTELYRTDHVLEGEVVSAQEQLTEAEVEEQDLNQRLNAGILKRYHEEQIWSDRIRRASTWGTWGLMGMNFLLFVVLQFVAEPWKRRRLAKAVVEEEKTVLEEVRNELEAVKTALNHQNNGGSTKTTTTTRSRIPSQVTSTESSLSAQRSPLEVRIQTEPFPPESWKEFLQEPERWERVARDVYRDLSSERRLDLRMRDASLLAIQGAAAGALIAWSMAWVLIRR